MRVKLVTHTSDPEKTIALGARVCYSGLPIHEIDLHPHEITPLLDKLKDMKHMSPFEHASFTFAISGISRACSHQLVRHRLASYSQRSQRYVKDVAPKWVMPETIRKSEFNTVYLSYLAGVMRLYTEMVDHGIPEEDARYILPNATDTQIIMTMNARELIHFCQTRTCNRAQLEIQTLAIDIAAILIGQFPDIFKGLLLPRCLIEGLCPEGDYECLRPISSRLRELK